MSQPLAATATRPPVLRDRDRTDRTDRIGEARRARLWTMIEIEALAYAGAFIDPSGILAVQRLRQAQEEERNGRR